MPESALKRTIDFSNVGDSRKPSAHVPPGDYLLEVENIAIERSQNGDFENVKWQFALVGFPGEGVVYETTTLKPGAEFALRDLLEAFGMSVPKKKVGIDFNQYRNKRVGATLKDNTYDAKKDGKLTGEQKTNSAVAVFFPASRVPAAGVVSMMPASAETEAPAPLNGSTTTLTNGRAATPVAETVNTAPPAADDEVEELTFVDEAI